MIDYLLEIKKSKFISFVFDCLSVKDFESTLESISKEHKKATHICFAYSFSDNGLKEKCFDDGEPKGTAGKPILNVIQKQNLSNIAVVVVRFFGGIKLGAGGLTRAYSKSASEAVKIFKAGN